MIGTQDGINLRGCVVVVRTVSAAKILFFCAVSTGPDLVLQAELGRYPIAHQMLLTWKRSAQGCVQFFLWKHLTAKEPDTRKSNPGPQILVQIVRPRK